MQRKLFPEFRYRLHLFKGGAEKDLPLRAVKNRQGAINAAKFFLYKYDSAAVEDIHAGKIIVTLNAHQKNPVPPSSRSHTRAKLQKGADLFQRFSGHDAEIIDEIEKPALDDVAIIIGELDAVCYTTVRDGKVEHYKHDFNRKSRPLLASSHDGEQLYILGGEYDFTERGIVDRY